jgi:hypothetical protein
VNRPLGISVAALLSLFVGLLNLLSGAGAFTLGGVRLWGHALPVFAHPARRPRPAPSGSARQ